MKSTVQKLNRLLRSEDLFCHKARGERTILDLGEYYVRNTRLNLLIATDVDPVAWLEEYRKDAAA